jgi:hypothetical protein
MNTARPNPGIESEKLIALISLGAHTGSQPTGSSGNFKLDNVASQDKQSSDAASKATGSGNPPPVASPEKSAGEAMEEDEEESEKRGWKKDRVQPEPEGEGPWQTASSRKAKKKTAKADREKSGTCTPSGHQWCHRQGAGLPL